MNNYKKKSLRLEDILHLLYKATGFNPERRGNSWQACCPSHKDKNPSLSVRQAENGTILFCCHAGCNLEEICAALGIKIRDLFPKKRKRSLPSLS